MCNSHSEAVSHTPDDRWEVLIKAEGIKQIIYIIRITDIYRTMMIMPQRQVHNLTESYTRNFLRIITQDLYAIRIFSTLNLDLMALENTLNMNSSPSAKMCLDSIMHDHVKRHPYALFLEKYLTAPVLIKAQITFKHQQTQFG